MTMTTKRRDGKPDVEIRDPAHLITAIPSLLGFRPANAVVLISLGGGEHCAIKAIVRMDLPTSEHEADVAEMMTSAICRSPGESALIVVVGRHPDHPPGESPPHCALVARLAACVQKLGREARFAAWVPEIRSGVSWQFYGPSQSTCPSALPDESGTEMAAFSVTQGHVTFESREEMARLLCPDEPVALERRARLLEEAVDALDPGLPPEQVFSAHARVIRAAIHRVRGGSDSFTDDQDVRLAMALSHPPVRDACLRTAFPPGEAQSRNAQRLWLALVRLVPAPERAEPASLLGYSAYMHGEGPLALMAFDNALDANPEHRLARMLQICLESGVPPTDLHSLGESVQDLYRPESLAFELARQNQRDPTR